MTAFPIEKDQGVDLDELEKFGKFQYIQYFWVCVPIFMVSMLHVNYVFIAEVPEYRCAVPECENGNSSVQTPDWWPNEVEVKCHRPVLNEELSFNTTDQTCSPSAFVGEAPCQEWVYATENSIVSAFNLGCNSWQATLVGTLHNAGMIVSMGITGWLADKIGRKPTVIICSVGGFIGLFKIFLTNFYAYLTVEFLESLLASGLYNVGVIIFIEVGGEPKRVAAGVIFAYAVYVGEVVYAVLAMSLKYWKYIIIVIYAPMILIISYVHLLKESTRWQMIRGKMPEAKQTFKCMARTNKLKITPKEIDALSDEQILSKFQVEVQIEKESMKDIFMSKEIVTRLVVSSICFFTSTFLYYGLIVNTIFLPGDKYGNFILSSITSFPGDLIAYFCMNKYGRKITLQAGYIICAAFMIAQVYAPDSMPWLKVILFLVGKMSCVVCFTSIYTYAIELFPTSVRGTLYGICTTVARVGSMLAPLTPLLVSFWDTLPSILFSSTAIVSAIALTFTPETKFIPLFDTIAQVSAHKKEKKDLKEVNSTHL